MIYILDDFLPPDLFEGIKDYISQNEFEIVKRGDLEFHVQYSYEEFNKYVAIRLSMMEGKKIKNILSLFRLSTDVIDADWRIHSDLIIEGQQPDRALVLYLSPPGTDDLNGTALWEHETYGRQLPKDASIEEFNKTILVDSEDLEKWKLNSVVGYSPNRLVSYPAHYFHSKYPNISWKEGRVVFVMFYSHED